MQIGFIGLGNMGHPMVVRLLKAGFTVKIYDVLPNAIKALVAEGAIAAKSAADVAEQSDAIITMLQTGEQVSEVCLGPAGIFSIAKKETLFIDSSSIDINVTRYLHQEAKKSNIAMLDAPVSGGVLAAENGQLTIMVGGEQSTYMRATPIFQILGKKAIYLGPAGNGQAAKISNNLILGISMIAVSEGFNLAQKLGLDTKLFFEVASNASSQCWSMLNNCPAPNILNNVPSSHDYKPGFAAKMMLKDLLLGQKAADSVSANIPLGKDAVELYSLFIKQGYGDLDFSGIFKLISNKT